MVGDPLQGLRGAVLVQNTYDWDTLAATVVRRSQAAHCSHMQSPEVQCVCWARGAKRQSAPGAEREAKRSRPSAAMFLTVPDQGPSTLARQWSCKRPLPVRHPRAPNVHFSALRRNEKECREADLGCLGGRAHRGHGYQLK